jgi:hypothetical protein
MTVENATSNDDAISYLKRKTKDWKCTILDHKYLHLRCCAHIVNLIVREGLESTLNQFRQLERQLSTSNLLLKD